MKRKYYYFLLEILNELLTKHIFQTLRVHWKISYLLSEHTYFWEKVFVVVHQQSRRAIRSVDDRKIQERIGIIHRVIANDKQGDRTIPGIGVAHGGYTVDIVDLDSSTYGGSIDFGIDDVVGIGDQRARGHYVARINMRIQFKKTTKRSKLSSSEAAAAFPPTWSQWFTWLHAYLLASVELHSQQIFKLSNPS